MSGKLHFQSFLKVKIFYHTTMNDVPEMFLLFHYQGTMWRALIRRQVYPIESQHLRKPKFKDMNGYFSFLLIKFGGGTC